MEDPKWLENPKWFSPHGTLVECITFADDTIGLRVLDVENPSGGALLTDADAMRLVRWLVGQALPLTDRRAVAAAIERTGWQQREDAAMAADIQHELRRRDRWADPEHHYRGGDL